MFPEGQKHEYQVNKGQMEHKEPFEKLDVLRRCGRIVNRSQTVSESILHCYFKVLSHGLIRPFRFWDESHGIINKDPCFK